MNPVAVCNHEYEASKQVNSIIAQESTFTEDPTGNNLAKAAVRKARIERQTDEANDSMTSCNQQHVDCSNVLARQVHHLGFPLSLLKSVVSASARVPLGMPSACATAGPYRM